MRIYKYKPREVFVIKWTGENLLEMKSFCNNHVQPELIYNWHIRECYATNRLVIDGCKKIVEIDDYVVKETEYGDCFVYDLETFHERYEE